MMLLLWIVALALAIVRVYLGMYVEPESFTWVNAYKDMAHVFIGGLLVAAWLKKNRTLWFLFWALNIVEVTVAIWSRL